jgi:hypothetical protein
MSVTVTGLTWGAVHAEYVVLFNIKYLKDEAFHKLSIETW